MKRILSMFVALFTALVMTLALSSPAEAAAPKKKRWISTKVVQKGHKLFIGGHVGPKNRYKRRFVIIQKKQCKRCRWKRVGRTRTNKRSNYRKRIFVRHDGRKDFFRVKTRRTKFYRASFSRVHWVRWT